MSHSKRTLYYQDNDKSNPLLPNTELVEIIHTLHIPSLQDPEDSSEASSEDEYDLMEPQDYYSQLPFLTTPATSASSATLGHSPTPDIQPSAQASRYRKRRDLIDLSNSNSAQNRELIDSSLRQSHILPEG